MNHTNISQKKVKDLYLLDDTFVDSMVVVLPLFFFVCVRYILKINKSRLQPLPFVFMLGIFLGYITKGLFEDSEYNIFSHEHNHNDYLKNTVIPVVMMNMCVNLDMNLPVRYWETVILVALIGSVCNFSLAILIYYRYNNSSILYCFIFALAFTPIYPMDMMNYLRSVNNTTRKILAILQGESIIGTCLCFMNFEFLLKFENPQSWWEYVKFYPNCIGQGLLIGFIGGKLISTALKFFLSPLRLVVITYIGPIWVYLVASYMIGQGGGLVALSVTGVMIAKLKLNMSKESQDFLESYWDCTATCWCSVGLLMAGLIAGSEGLKYYEYSDNAYALLDYIFNAVIRLGQYIVVMYVLKLLSIRINLKQIIVLIDGGVFSVINFAVLVETFNHPSLEREARGSVTHVSGTILLTMILNVSVVPYLVEILGLNEISLNNQANMNKCIVYLINSRDHSIAMLKIDRYHCDANWFYINEATTIKHPYQVENIKKYEEREVELQFEKTAICPKCHQEARIITTERKYENSEREAKLRILKAREVIYFRQFERGDLTKVAFCLLMNEVESAKETDFMMKPKNLAKLFNSSQFMAKCRLFILRRSHDEQQYWLIRKPRNRLRRYCYIVVFHRIFDYFMCMIVISNGITTVSEIALRIEKMEDWPYGFFNFKRIESILGFIFLFIYFIEFVLKIMALSFVFIWRDGVKSYFRSNWRKFEFVCLNISLIVVGDVILETILSDNDVFSTIGVYVYVLDSIIILRIYILILKTLPLLLQFIENHINSKKQIAYIVGRSFVKGEEDIVLLLPMIVLDLDLKENLKRIIELDRIEIVKELSKLQRDYPSLMVNIKTNHAIKVTIKSMYEAIEEFESIGWVGDIDQAKLKKSVELQEATFRKLGNIESNSPSQILAGIPWMGDDENIVDFFLSCSKKFECKAGEHICQKRLHTKGIYIVISGLFKLNYRTTRDAKSRKESIVDYVNCTDFGLENVDYFVSGNSFGEMALLTGRPYSCTIKAECSSKVYLIETACVKEAMEIDSHPLYGLQARMWKSATIKMAFGILAKLPIYYGIRRSKIETMLIRGLVPDFREKKFFTTDNFIEDIILVNGLIMDVGSKIVYQAPAYIPRNVRKIELLSSSSVPTKLFLVLKPHVESDQLMALIEDENNGNHKMLPKNENLRAKWLENLNCTLTNLKQYYVCSQHFSPECFQQNEFRKTLKPQSVPTILCTQEAVKCEVKEEEIDIDDSPPLEEHILPTFDQNVYTNTSGDLDFKISLSPSTQEDRNSDSDTLSAISSQSTSISFPGGRNNFDGESDSETMSAIFSSSPSITASDTSLSRTFKKPKYFGEFKLYHLETVSGRRRFYKVAQSRVDGLKKKVKALQQQVRRLKSSVKTSVKTMKNSKSSDQSNR